MNIHRKRNGFTLPEILVAVAIFSVIGFITTKLFTGAIRTTKRGYQSIEAYEMGRSALSVMERDLSSVYTARDLGDFHTFYGTPIGMTFITLSDDSGTGNVSRITYALTVAGPGNKEVVTGDDASLQTYSIIRFVERGVEDLDSFNYRWPTPDELIENPGGSVDTREESRLNRELNDIVESLEEEYPNLDLANNDEDREYVANHQAFRAKKRELWIRMIAGDFRLPDIWRYWDNQAFGDDEKEAADYILAENVIIRNNPMGDDENSAIVFEGFIPFWSYFDNPRVRDRFTIVDLFSEELFFPKNELEIMDFYGVYDEGNDRVIPLLPLKPIFKFGYVGLDGTPILNNEWGDAFNLDQAAPHIPELVGVDFTVLMGSPFPGVADYRDSFVQLFDLKAGYTRKGSTS